MAEMTQGPPPAPKPIRHGPPWTVWDCPHCDWKQVSAVIPEFWVESDCPECDSLVMPVKVAPGDSWSADDENPPEQETPRAEHRTRTP